MELIKILSSIVVLIFCYNKVVCYDNFEGKQNTMSEDEESDSEIFIPTMEWQEVKKNQRIPKGLHVQLNLQTGVRRAKLMDSSENEDRTALLSVPGQTEKEELQKAENSEKKPAINLDNIGAVNPETFPKIKQKYRSYKEIKEDFKDLELGIKTELELMNELMDLFAQIKDKKYNDNDGKDEKVWLNTLTDLEYLVHQVDNARIFTKNNGIKNIVFPSLNSTLPEIRAQGGRLLGAACQNNVPSQISALESGAIRELLHMFSSDSSPSVQSSALYGLSCIIRNFPVAQKLLIDTGGLGILNSVFNGESSDQLKLQVKVVTLINDLMIERLEVEQTIEEMRKDNTTDPTLLEEAIEKQQQYNLVDLSDKLLEQKWCQHLVDILLKQILPVEHSNDYTVNKMAHQLNHDNIEKIIKAISISTVCEGKFKDNALLKKALLNLIKLYAELSQEELASGDTDIYYTGIHKDIANILSKLR